MKYVLAACLIACCLAPFASFAQTPEQRGYIIATDTVPADGKTPASHAIQKLIDDNPNRTIFFPDGIYRIDKPIRTPADPNKSVSLLLSDFAVFQAEWDWDHTGAMVQLGGIFPYNSISMPGSNYSFTGGIIDGSNVADGISIDSGRETVIRNVSIKHTRIGITIKHGANNGSSDADITGVNIVGNGAEDSIGVLIIGYDNTLTNMRIANVVTGVEIRSAGNCLRNIHPLFTGDWRFFEKSQGFYNHGDNNWFDFCYSDNFATAFHNGENAAGVFHNCFCFWYSPTGKSHTVFRCDGAFNAQVSNLRVGFNGAEDSQAVHRILQCSKDGGTGFFSHLTFDKNLLNNDDDKYLSFMEK